MPTKETIMKMQKLDSLEGLFIHQLKDIYNAEHQIAKVLPRMADVANSERLRDIILEHLDQTHWQIEQLDRVFDHLGLTPRGIRCEAMTGIIEEGREFIEDSGDAGVKDAALIAIAQKIKHYEMATYGCLCTWATLLGHERVSDVLEDILDQEKETDLILTEIAVNIINRRAVEVGDIEEEVMYG
jgi:ferritin-like metal-binding protein YciE